MLTEMDLKRHYPVHRLRSLDEQESFSTYTYGTYCEANH